MKKLIVYILLILTLPVNLIGDDTKTVGTNGADYPTLLDAFFDINSGILTGVITLQIIDNTSEYAPAELFESGYGGSQGYTSVTIYPTSSGLSITGDFDAPLIILNGATNVTIDGRVNGVGSAIDLVITNINTGTSASTIQFINDASTNIIRYSTIMGSSTNTAGGVIFFSTSGIGTGNDGNTIGLNNITADPAGRPVNVIYSAGTSGQENSGNIISDNNIFDFLKHGTASNGVLFASNTTSCTISGNSFYETGSFVPSASVTYNIIKIDNTSGTGFTVSDNYIGGRSALCGGLAWTKTNAANNAFFAISLNVGTGTASSIQNNTIKNFSWSNSTNANWTGIHIAGGAVNIGTSTGNTIGDATGTGSITLTAGTTNSTLYGINIATTGTVDCQNNIIGSISSSTASTLAASIIGINKTGTTGTTNISDNTIGSSITANSINASSASTANAQTVFGINNLGSGTITISNNTIANLTNAVSNTSVSSRGRITGIYSATGTNIISSNTIYNLTIANANDAVIQIASVCGIALFGVTPKSLTGNTIYNLSNTYSSFVGSVIGIYYVGSTAGNEVRENFIHSLSVANGSSASIYGIKISSGLTTYSNNIITLNGTTATDIYGIYETGAAGNNNSLYFNTVYIGGNLGGGTNKSYALYSAATTNTRNFRNNIFFNARSTTGGSNLHFAIYILTAGGTLNCDFNDYFVSGDGSTLGFYGTPKTTLPVVTGQDVNSFAVNPLLSNAGGTAALNYLPSEASLVAVTGTGITTDYAGTTRSVTFPSMGAYEYTVAPGAWIWMGSAGTDWSVPANWNYISVPPASSDVIITDVANDPIVNEPPATPAECENLTINSGAILTVAAGGALRVNGTITNNAGITGLVIKSDATGDGNLVNNTASVPATVELYLTGGLVSPGVGRFHYFVPPVATMTIGTVPTVAEVQTALGITNFNGDLLRYREPFAVTTKNQGWQYFHNYPGVPPGFTSLVSDYGYNIFLNGGDDILKFTGQLNATEHLFSLSYTPGNAGAGWNLIGNPYPCNYDLNGIAGLGTVVAGISNTVYYNNNGTYGYWNVLTNTGSSGGYTDILPPMTGFYVKVSSGGPSSLTLPVTSKTGSASDARSAHKGSEATSEKSEKGGLYIQKVKLVLTSGLKTDETVAMLIDDATAAYNEHYDAYKLYGSSTLPSIDINTGGTDYFMKAVRGPETEAVILPLKVIVREAGTQSISISEFENLEGIKVVLKHGNIETNLSKDATYTFTSLAGTYTDFQLIIGETNITTEIEKPIDQNFKTWYNNNYLYINTPSEISSEKYNLVIYDLQGKPVYNDNNIFLTAGQTIQLPVILSKGIYIIRITNNSLSLVSKIVVI
ncbi:MAG: T9SS type A sorting domain-containing protein [Bacteroidales bacterium]|nr:T9SS type A sorting domain-containing protein [Bacteroidales bacterium]